MPKSKFKSSIIDNAKPEVEFSLDYVQLLMLESRRKGRTKMEQIQLLLLAKNITSTTMRHLNERVVTKINAEYAGGSLNHWIKTEAQLDKLLSTVG